MSVHTHIRRQQGTNSRASAPSKGLDPVTSQVSQDEQLTPAQVLQLQRTVGNQAVMRMISKAPHPSVQRKFTYNRTLYNTKEAGEELADEIYIDEEEQIDLEVFKTTLGQLAKDKKNHGTFKSEFELVQAVKQSMGIGEEVQVKQVVWAMEGVYARVTQNVIDSMPEGCQPNNLQDALNTPVSLKGRDIIKKMQGTGEDEYELKLSGAGKQRCYGFMNSGMIEFTSDFRKGKGK